MKWPYGQTTTLGRPPYDEDEQRPVHHWVTTSWLEGSQVSESVSCVYSGALQLEQGTCGHIQRHFWLSLLGMFFGSYAKRPGTL